MKCIDFDKEFQRYLTVWMKEHSKDYKNVEAMENAMPEVYGTFLDTPAAFLAGQKPGEYFESYGDARQLVNWMEDYYKQRVPVPDMLLNRISELGGAAEGPLMNLLTKERTPREARMCAVTLLREIESEAPLDMYVDWQCARTDGDDEMADNALESLASLQDAAREKMRAAISRATPAGQEALLSLLCHFESDETLFEVAMGLLRDRPERAAVLADYISCLGDERALPELKRLAASEETAYLDYIELRSAIEKLGGEAPERQFDAPDPAYEALRGMQ